MKRFSLLLPLAMLAVTACGAQPAAPTVAPPTQVIPTSTPLPTDTPVPTATPTPLPTNTPTRTPWPTRTPRPTKTPDPALQGVTIPVELFPNYAVYFGELKGGAHKASLVIAHVPQRIPGGGLYFVYYFVSKRDQGAFAFLVTETNTGTYRVKRDPVEFEFTASATSLRGTLTYLPDGRKYSFSLAPRGTGRAALIQAVTDAFLLGAHGCICGWVSPGFADDMIKRTGLKPP